MDDDTDKFVADFLERLTAFTKRETDKCPHCGTQVKSMRKVGRCIYSSPCGCRLWQGQIPEAWLDDATRHG